jgi:hypothetical protein
MQAYEFIDDHHLVTDVFGAWPSFHDAEVHRVVLDRTRRLPSGSHSLVKFLDSGEQRNDGLGMVAACPKT